MSQSSSLNTDWKRSAGNFMCLSCRRKRLPASYFSKSQQAKGLKSRRSEFHEAKCKECVVKEEEKRSKSSKAFHYEKDKLLICSSCKETLAASFFSGSQRTKLSRGQKGRCKACVIKAEKEELDAAAVKQSLKAYTKSKHTPSVLMAACKEAAAQAEAVTGISAKRGMQGRGKCGSARANKLAKIKAAKARRAKK